MVDQSGNAMSAVVSSLDMYFSTHQHCILSCLVHGEWCPEIWNVVPNYNPGFTGSA